MSHTNGNPAACIKVVHSKRKDIPSYAMDFEATGNQFGLVRMGIMSWSYTAEGTPDTLTCRIDDNRFRGTVTAIGLGGYD